MAKVFSFTAKATIPIGGVFSGGIAGGVARAEDKAQLTGHWNFNQDQSDDAEQKVHDAQQNSRINARQQRRYLSGRRRRIPRRGRRLSRWGTWVAWRPRRHGRAWADGGGGMGRGGRQGTQNREWRQRARSGIASRRIPSTCGSTSAPTRLWSSTTPTTPKPFTLTAKSMTIRMRTGRKFSTKASWEGGAFIAETKLPHSEKLTQTFRVSEDGKQLFVTTRFEDSSLAGPLSIRRVYDVGKYGAAKLVASDGGRSRSAPAPNPSSTPNRLRRGSPVRR